MKLMYFLHHNAVSLCQLQKNEHVTILDTFEALDSKLNLTCKAIAATIL